MGFGVAVAQGDLPDGSTHNLAVPLLGPHAGEWIDLGTLGGAQSGWDEGLVTISDTGLIVGHSASTDQNRPHGVVWSEKSGMVDLGTLADIGYTAYNSSYAAGVTGWNADRRLEWNRGQLSRLYSGAARGLDTVDGVEERAHRRHLDHPQARYDRF